MGGDQGDHVFAPGLSPGWVSTNGREAVASGVSSTGNSRPLLDRARQLLPRHGGHGREAGEPHLLEAGVSGVTQASRSGAIWAIGIEAHATEFQGKGHDTT